MIIQLETGAEGAWSLAYSPQICESWAANCQFAQFTPTNARSWCSGLSGHLLRSRRWRLYALYRTPPGYPS